MLYYEKQAKRKGYKFVIGIDEVGRGTLAGPVVASAVILKTYKFKNPIRDSKKLTPLQRENAFYEIINKAHVGIGVMNEGVVDYFNIIVATKLAMEQSIEHLKINFRKKINKNKTIALVDGNVALDLDFRYKNIIRGDSKSLSVACASIVAKVTRDRMMFIYSKTYPNYEFDRHKGYGTKRHMGLINQFGQCPIHRRTFAPLNQIDSK